MVNERTKAILVNNPSNPCGSVWSKAHMDEIIEFSTKHKIPIVSDEIYYGLSYDDECEFVSFPHHNTEVPMITISGLSKIYMVPGWRLGWATVYNKHGYFDDIIEGMKRLSMIWLHPCTVVQFSVKDILNKVKEDHFDNLKNKLKEAADAVQEYLEPINGLKPIRGQGAMYMMV